MAMIMFITCCLAVLLTFFGGIMLGEIGLSIGGCLSILAGLLNTFLTPKYFAKSVIEIWCNDTCIEIANKKPFYGSKINKKISMRFDDFKSYKFEATSNFSTFIITLKDGSTHKFHRWYNDNNDQFDEFYKVFTQKIKIINKTHRFSNEIKREKSILENRTFLIVIAIILTLIILATIILLFTRGVQNKSGFIYIFIFLGPLVWLANQIYNGLRK